MNKRTIIIGREAWRNGQDVFEEEIIRGTHIEILEQRSDNTPILIVKNGYNIIAMYKRWDSIKFREALEDIE